MTLIIEGKDVLRFCPITGKPIEQVEYRTVPDIMDRQVVQLGDCNDLVTETQQKSAFAVDAEGIIVGGDLV
ncbi:MAG: hypothetical protein HGA79_01110 [Anaerolineales bacterium]|nr:hypothetical protein [Anaerolineales bacterium]